MKYGFLFGAGRILLYSKNQFFKEKIGYILVELIKNTTSTREKER